MRFLENALRNAGRRFRVIPLRGKDAFLKGWPELATTEEPTIREWAARFPDANVGVCGGADVIILDTDRLSRLRELCGENWEVWSRTYSVSSGRPDRAHLYYRATEEVLAFGNKRWKEAGLAGNVFEIKAKGALVVAEGSVHPDTGGIYVITQDLPLIPFPAGLFQLLRDSWSRQNPTGKREWTLPVHDGEGRDDFMIQQAGRLRNIGASEAIIRAHLEEINSDPSIMADPKSSEDLDRIARSAARYDAPAPDPKIILGNSTAPEPAPLRQKNRPIYPTEVWDGTAVGEFAKLCSHDNNIPRKLYAEAFRCALGAIVGDRISCPVEGALPRSYTVIVAPKGKGKGTAIRRAVRFFSQEWYGTATAPGLLSGARDFIWKSQGIGAWMTAASSVPGMARLCKDLEKTLKNSPHLTWANTLPRILSVHEEMKTFLSTLFIEGGVGSGMEGVVCQLWDDVSFNGTATGTREAIYGEMMFSLLAGVTEEDWFDILARGNAVGGGLMSRFNLVGTEGEYKNVGRMDPPDFTALQESFLPRIRLLADAHTRVPPTEGADKIISDWLDTLPEGSERLNVHAWRSALLLAWLRREEAITPKTAEEAVRLGQYQVDSHDYYRTKAADNVTAKVQAKILRALEMKGPLPKRKIQQLTHASRSGTEVWNRAIEGLLKDHSVGKREDGSYYLAVK